MRKTILLAAIFICCNGLKAQSIHERLDEKVKQLLATPQMKHAIMGFYVINSKTGKVEYDLNGQFGLAAASTQKIFTTMASLDTLGVGYRYKTQLGYSGNIKDSVLNGNLVIAGYGDPSFGSWRYPQTKMEEVLRKIAGLVQGAGINTINGNLVLDDTRFGYEPVPGGWPWDDIGNYYGAGTWAINWNENQYDLVFEPGENVGDGTAVLGTNPPLLPVLDNLVTTGPKGSGDESNIYLAPFGQYAFADGTVPAGEKSFTVSGAMPYPADVLGKQLADYFATAGIKLKGDIETGFKLFNNKQLVPGFTDTLATVYSPTLDSLVYWFLQKSINFYGETFAKTIGYELTGSASTAKGVGIIRDYWEKRGIEKSALKMIDGSGLSPANRVTAMAEVTALQYAKQQPWFGSFYKALPTINGTKMKSGTIGGAKAFAGYQTSADGSQYTFSIIINNYDGGVSAIVEKMYGLLDVLK